MEESKYTVIKKLFNNKLNLINERFSNNISREYPKKC